jgi:CMP-N-acetylneuraminic acid synthetase
MWAIVLARGGSKRLPGKNLLPLAGVPLISHTLLAARNSGKFGKILVSTDSPEIARIAVSTGAEVPFLRKPELSTDESSSIEGCLDVLQFMERQGSRTDSFALLQPTSPLRTSEDIREAVSLFEREKANAVVSVVPLGASAKKIPADWKKNIDAHGFLSPSSEGGAVVVPNGAIYLVLTELFLQEKTFYPPRTLPYVMPERKSIDIDTADDFARAENFLKACAQN